MHDSTTPNPLDDPSNVATFSTWHAREDLRTLLTDLADVTTERTLCDVSDDLRELSRLITVCTIAVQQRAARIAGIEQLHFPVAV